jgi:hypothetical protein
MYKNTILNNAIGAVLTLPRRVLWTTTIAVAAFSLEAGVSIVGQQFSQAIGTPTAQAGEGSFTNDCNGLTPIDPTTGLFSGGPSTAGTGLNSANVPNPCAGTESGVKYATEIVQAGTPTAGLPSGDNDYQVVKYVWSAKEGHKYTGKFDMTLSLPNGGQLDKMAVKVIGNALIDAADDVTNDNDGVPCPIANITVSNPKATINAGVAAGCTIVDSGEIYVAFKLKGITASTLKDSEVKLDVTLKDTTPFPPNPTRSLVVAELAPGLTISVIPESGGFTYTSSAMEDKEFTSTDTTGTSTSYISQNEAQIGFIQFTTDTSVFGADAKTPFSPGQVGDTGTFTITNGQFAASKGDANGKAYLLAGSEINADVVDPPVADTKTWTLTAAQLKTMANYDNGNNNKGKVPIRIRVDGSTPVNPIDGDPVGTIEVKLGSLVPSPTIKAPECATCTSPLLRIPSDGKTCWIHNIPDIGTLDTFSLRITNNHPTMPAKVTGTMYHEDGTSDDFTSVVVAEAIPARASIRLGVEDLVTLGTSVTWKDSAFGGKERRIMKLVSTVPDVEVFNLIRGQGGSQPMVNVSTGVRGFDCYPR